MKNVIIRKALDSECEAIKNIYQLYEYDFTEMNSGDVNSLGLFVEDFDLDIFFTDKDKAIYIILVNDKIAGFFMMKHYPYILSEKVNCIAEFFIMRKYRKSGIGQLAAKYIFDNYQGRMIIEVRKNNIKAIPFWNKAIEKIKPKVNKITEGTHRNIEWFIHDIII